MPATRGEEAWRLATSIWDTSKVRQTCRVRETTRFRRFNAVSARSHALGLARVTSVHVVSAEVAAALPDYDSKEHQTGAEI